MASVSWCCFAVGSLELLKSKKKGKVRLLNLSWSAVNVITCLSSWRLQKQSRVILWNYSTKLCKMWEAPTNWMQPYNDVNNQHATCYGTKYIDQVLLCKWPGKVSKRGIGNAMEDAHWFTWTCFIEWSTRYWWICQWHLAEVIPLCMEKF